MMEIFLRFNSYLTNGRENTKVELVGSTTNDNNIYIYIYKSINIKIYIYKIMVIAIAHHPKATAQSVRSIQAESVPW